MSSSFPYTLRDRTAIVGVGYTEFSKRSGVSTLTLAQRAITAALEDAGLTHRDLDGVVCYRLGDSASPHYVAQTLGLQNVNLVLDVAGGGSSSAGVVAQVAAAIASGQAECVVCWRALNARSGMRTGGTTSTGSTVDSSSSFSPEWSYWRPYRHSAPAQTHSMAMNRFMVERGITVEDLGRVAINQRANAILNPRALMTKPLTMEEYLASRWIVEPLRLFDCCLETDCAVALVITTAERARDLAQVPVTITAGGFGGGNFSTTGHWDPSAVPAAQMAPRLFAAAGLGPADIDVAQFYDAFTPLVLIQLEAYGFCEWGAVGRDGRRRSDEARRNAPGQHSWGTFVGGLRPRIEPHRRSRQSTTRRVWCTPGAAS